MQLTDLVAAMSAGWNRVEVEFGGGETFLRFKEAMLFLDRLRRLVGEKRIRVDARILTNGTAATPEQLRECLARRISLTFSIDGPQTEHDAFRQFPDGKPTHRLALENWRRYCELVNGVADPPGCEVSAVIAGDSRLADVARFWREQGVKRFKAIPAEPSRFLGPQELEAWQTRRDRYLQDMKTLAFAEAERLRGREFESEFEGPLGILGSWRRLSRGAPYRVCGAGNSIIAVDALGNLFPCQGFAGFAQRSIGDVHSGVLPAKLQEFRATRLRVQDSCNGCWARFLCDGGCCAGDPEAGVVLDYWNGCEFTRAHAEIAIQSYLYWRSHAALPTGTPQ
jgi:uncharacterized protein